MTAAGGEETAVAAEILGMNVRSGEQPTCAAAREWDIGGGGEMGSTLPSGDRVSFAHHDGGRHREQLEEPRGQTVVPG